MKKAINVLFALFLLCQITTAQVNFGTVCCDSAGTMTAVKESAILVFASGKQNNNQTVTSRNATITRTATGFYNVTFATAHPDGAAYEVLFGQDERSNTRDAVDPHVVTNSQTATGFQVWVGTGDNGANPDVPVTNPFSFAVLYEREIVIDIQ